jgi:hypothetical protein
MDALEQPGDFCFASRDGAEAVLILLCPACGAEHGVPLAPYGNVPAPLLVPVVNGALAAHVARINAALDWGATS